MCHGQVTWDDIVGPWSSIPWRGNPGIMGYWNPDEHVLTISKYLQCQAKFDMAHRPATKTWHLAGWFISSTLQQTTEVRKLYEWLIPQGLASIYIYRDLNHTHPTYHNMKWLGVTSPGPSESQDPGFPQSKGYLGKSWCTFQQVMVDTIIQWWISPMLDEPETRLI